jgi:hypothetical protein
VQKVSEIDRTDCEIITFEVERKVFFSLCTAGTTDFDHHLCKKI